MSHALDAEQILKEVRFNLGREPPDPSHRVCPIMMRP